MREIPILFSTEMVKAILDGRKTMTRRVIKPQPPEKWDSCKPIYNPDGKLLSFSFFKSDDIYDYGYIKKILCLPGDVLWVRETYVLTNYGNPVYKADFRDKSGEYWHSIASDPTGVTWRPSIHMPREDARLFLTVKDIRVERLQGIRQEDAKSEGITEYLSQFSNYYPEEADIWRNRTTIENFSALWDSIYAKRGYGWDSNCWVWVVTFERRAQA